MKPKRRHAGNAATTEQVLPMSLDELVRIPGGPFALIEQAEQRAGDEVASFWLGVLEQHVPQIPVEDMGDVMLSAIAQSWIKSLRKRLGIRPSPDEVRAQTRERVRRFRARIHAR
jgi:hypothetical protein